MSEFGDGYRAGLVVSDDRLREALVWALRNNGGECPADDPAGYAKALRALLATPPAPSDHGALDVAALREALPLHPERVMEDLKHPSRPAE